MNVLLLEDQTLLRQAIGMARPPIADNSEISAYGSYDQLYASETRLKRFDAAILDPGVPPVPSPTSSNARDKRFQAISNLKTKLSRNCRIVVLTGSYDDHERLAMLSIGVDDYVSKDTMDLITLRRVIESPGHARRCLAKNKEQYDTTMTIAESIGHAVHQGIYDEQTTAQTLNIDVDTVKKYVKRARKKIANR